jgi:hypothetical protein
LNALIHERGADEILFVSNNRAGGLPRESQWARPAECVSVSAEDDEAVGRSVREWAGHVEAGRIGKPIGS